jgi:hypothetical protein
MKLALPMLLAAAVFSAAAPDKEQALGKELAAQFERENSPLNDPVVAAYVNRIGQGLAKAAALAGAIQMLPGHNPAYAQDSLISYATRNTAMQGTVTIDSITFGYWDDDASSFTPYGSYFTANAVRVVVSRPSSGLTMSSMFGLPAPRINARALAWARAPVLRGRRLPVQGRAPRGDAGHDPEAGAGLISQG